MLKKSASAKTVSREASLVKRISQAGKSMLTNDERRETRDERRTTGEEDGLFEHPAWLTPVVSEVRASEFLACPISFSAAC